MVLGFVCATDGIGKRLPRSYWLQLGSPFFEASAVELTQSSKLQTIGHGRIRNHRSGFPHKAFKQVTG
jgi:hypothetical protein